MSGDTSDRDTRPSPDALLVQAEREGRGRLKIFLGPYPGVGKTFAMLAAAQERRREGTDVVVGIVETHGRIETEALLRGLDVLARKHISYRSRVFGEMDIDAILWRKPKLVVVDEFAHTNVPGSRHGKRWQDVEELLAAGIDVYTTLNVQHLESLNDVVARISRVRVRETLPDNVLQSADEIELIDLPPDDLLHRLREGKVYVRDQVGRAVRHFFSKGNLTAFRELAMRVAVERLDAEVVGFMRAHAIPGPWPTQDRLMVCVNESPLCTKLVRATKRAADRQHAPWVAVSVETPRRAALPDEAKDRVAEALRLAESLGAEVVTLHAESNVAEELLAFARGRNVTRLVLGRPRRRVWSGLLHEDVGRKLIRKAEGLEVILIAPDQPEPVEERLRSAVPKPHIAADVYGFATLTVVSAAVVAFWVRDFLPLPNVSLVFLTAVVFVAARWGLWPSVYTALLSFIVYNFFFTEPYYTFNVLEDRDLLTILFFLAVAILVGNLAARLQAQVATMRRTVRRTENLYDFSRKVAAAAGLDDVLWAAVHHVAATLECRALVLLPKREGTGLEIAAGYPPEDRLQSRDWGAAEWAWEHRKPAGWGSDTLPAAAWLFLPLETPRDPIGLVGVSFGEEGRLLTPDQRRLLETLVQQVALAVERTHLATDIEEARVHAETERLRAALLSSVSHDLRTPLVSIIGAATSLNSMREGLSEDDRAQLIRAILGESERLNRYVQNLLDMTRLGYGALQPNREWSDIREIAGRAAKQMARSASGVRVELEIPDDLPALHVDPVLIEQVMVNLLDNAIKHSPADGRVIVSAARQDDALAVRVTDQGPGIPADQRTAVFDMFYRVRGGDRRMVGTGLGLSICRGLIEAHGGRIEAKAGPGGRGATIAFTLPVATMPAVSDTDDGPAPEVQASA